MNRFRLVHAFAVLGCLAMAPSAFAQSGATDPDAAAVTDDAGEAAEIKAWIKELEDARARLRDANERLARLDAIKGRGAANRYPRGDAKAKYLSEIQSAQDERDDAVRAFPQVVEDARRAGVPPGVLSDYEDEADAMVAAADAAADDTDDPYQPENTDDNEYEAQNTDDAEYKATNTDDAEEADPSDD
jgi:hypothetical protein